MDIGDINKELDDLKQKNYASKRPRSANFNVRHANFKAIIAKLVALSLLMLVFILGVYSIITLKTDAGQINNILAGMVFVYLILGGLIALKIWNIEFIGWFTMFLISISGILLPLLTFISKGFYVELVPIMLVSALYLVIMWAIKDLYGVNTLKDIFNPF
jgi:hypothetical protein